MAAPSRLPSARRLPPLIAGGLVAVALVVAVGGRLTGAGRPQPTTTALAERALTFRDMPDGSVLIADAATGRTIDRAVGEQGFLRGTLRGFARERHQRGLGADAPLRLTAWADHRLTLEDPATGRQTDLEAFGSTNEAVFARLLTLPEGDTP